jgi:hypothetical protein
MNKCKIIRLVIFLLLIISLAACSNKAKQQKEDSFTKLLPIPTGDMNDEIKLSLPGLERGFYKPKIGEFITLVLNNQSNKIIVFPADYGLKMYLYNYEEQTWIEVKNLEKYSTEENNQVSPINEGSLSQILVSALPSLDTTSDPIDMRVMVIGTIYKDGIPTDKQVGAYMDITLQP